MALISSPNQRSIKPKLSFDSIPRKVGELYLVVSEGTLCSIYEKNKDLENVGTYVQAKIECQEQLTPLVKGRQMNWNSKFKYDIWSYHFVLTLQLFRLVKDKPKKISEYSLPLDVKAISSGQVLNVPFPGEKRKSPVALVKLFLQFIYLSHEYTKLENLILNNPSILGAIIDAYKSIKIHSTEELSSALHCLFASHNRQLELQKYIVTHEIERISDINLMFRADTLGIQLITEFVNRTGNVFLEKFSEQFMKTTNFKLTIELDPELLKTEEERKINQKRMIERADSFFDALLACQKYIHPHIRDICKYIMVSMSKRMAGESKHIQEQIQKDSYIAMGAILFLRYICPCLVRLCVNIDRRSTVLLAKLVTAIGNNVTFGDKEPYMNSMNDYVTKKKAWMETFFTKILNSHSVLEVQPHQQEATPLYVYRTLLGFFRENQQVLVDHLSRIKSEKESSISEKFLDVLYEFTTREVGELYTVPSLPNMSLTRESSPAGSPPTTKLIAFSSPTSTSPSASNSSLLGQEICYSESLSSQYLASIRS